MAENSPESNAFEPGMAGTGARTLSEAEIEGLRQLGGVFVGAVRATRMAMALTDPNLPGNPIVFANQSFLELSGYGLDEVLGQQPYFMNGPDTAPEDAARFRDAIEKDRDEVIETVQYRKDRSRFVAALFLSAFKDEDGRTLHHFLSWGDVTARVDAAGDAAALRAAQSALEESEARQAFLLRLSDSLLPLADPIEIQARSARVLGEHLGCGRACYAEVDLEAGEYVVARDWHRPGETSHAGRYPTDSWPMPWLANGRTWVVRDCATDPAMPADQRESYRGNGIGALVVVPLIKSGRLVAAFLANQRTPRAWTAAEIGLVEETAERTWAAVQRARAEAALRESEERLAAAFDVLPVGIGVLGLDGKLILSNPEVKRFLPTDTVPSLDEQRRGRWKTVDRVGEAVDPSDWPSARALRGERAHPGIEMLYVDDDGNEIWTKVASAPIRDPAGAITGAVVVIHDVTAFKRADERQRMLLAELQHRVRNILAMIRSMVRRTAESSATVEDYAQHLEGRIGALARTQAMLTREPGRGVDLQTIVEGELLSIAAQSRQYSCQGPPLILAPKAAEVLSLAIHELATNAIKYGAFSTPGGRLDVGWSTRPRDGEAWLTLHWIESGVNDVTLPEREGFGIELITRRVPYELDGRGEVQPGADGISAIIELPLRNGASLLETRAANDS